MLRVVGNLTTVLQDLSAAPRSMAHFPKPNSKEAALAANVTDQIVSYVCSTPVNSLEPQVLNAVKRHWIDGLAATFAGIATPAAQQLRRFASTCGGSAEASVIGEPQRVPSVHAAFANGVTAHAIDYDDTSWSLFGHPTAVVLPVVLALGEQIGAAGSQALAAFTIGVEVSCKLGRLLCPAHYERGWHATSTLGVFGATCAAGRLLQLEPRQLSQALGLAAAQSGGLRRNFGSMAKPFQAGMAARNAVTAALLASQGFTAGECILDDAAGYLEAYAGAQPAAPLDLSRCLGQPYDIVDPGFAIKIYPTCAFTHCAIDAAIELVRRHGIAPERVAGIDCRVNPLAPNILIHHTPRTALEGKFSMEFCLAAAVRHAAVGPAQVTDEEVNDPRSRDLMSRITMTPDAELAGEEAARLSPAVVTMTLRDGETYRCEVAAPRGSGRNPVSDDEVRDKFRQCAAPHLDNAAIDRCLDLLRHLERCASLDELTELWRFST